MYGSRPVVKNMDRWIDGVTRDVRKLLDTSRLRKFVCLCTGDAACSLCGMNGISKYSLN